MHDVYIPASEKLWEMEVSLIKDYYDILVAALNEAAAFANKRLPRDMRDFNADENYYKQLWLTCAIEKLKGERNGIQSANTDPSGSRQ